MKPTIAENKKRIDKLFVYNDPILGIGSPIERFKFKIFENSKEVYLPMAMMDIPFIAKSLKNKSLETYCNKTKQSVEVLYRKLSAIRFIYDFEFWAYIAVKIKQKGGSELIPFKLRPAQRKLLSALEKLRLSGEPIRVILLKARQWGGSTLIQIYMGWIQCIHKERWSSLIVGDIEDQARNVRFMYSTMVGNYPEELGNLTLSSFEGSTKNKIIKERNCVINIGSMQQPEGIRSADINMAHLTEVGSWKKTEGKKPEDLIQSIQGTISNKPYCLYIIESTAKGTGNFFHRSWTNAKTGVSNLTPVFIAWFEIEEYVKYFNSDKEREDLIKSLTEHEIMLWNLGASLEGINWYRDKLATMEGDIWAMRSEFPSTDREAFQTSGRLAFVPEYIQNLESSICKPKLIGDMFPNTLRGKEALEDVSFVESPTGSLKIWREPNDPPIPEGKVMKDRYGLFVDIGGRTDKADYSTISVFDRYWMAEGGLPERAATWRGHLDQDLFAWKAVQVAMYYMDGLLAFESNSLRKHENTEGVHYLTILDEISNHYRNLYTRTKPEQIVAGAPTLYGFHTNSATKSMIVNSYNAILRDRGYIEHDLVAKEEAEWYEIKADGSLGATDGQHDDVLMGTMGGLWMCTQYMKLPIIEDKVSSRPELPMKTKKSLASY